MDENELPPEDDASVDAAARAFQTLWTSPPKEDAAPEGEPESDAVNTAEDPAPEEQDGGDDTPKEEPEAPVINPPASWDAEAKAKFAQLPPDLQQVIADRESQRDRGTSKALQEASEARKAAEAEVAKLANERAQELARLQSLAVAMETAVADEFADIRTQADLVRLSETDPARWAKWQAKSNLLQAAQAAHAQEAQRQAIARQAAEEARTREEFAKLVEVEPAFADEAKARVIRDDILVAAKTLGFDPQELSGITDHRLVRALKYMAAGIKAEQAAKTIATKKVEAPVPKAAKPNASARPGDMQAERRTEAFKQLRKSGSVQDAAALLRGLI